MKNVSIEERITLGISDDDGNHRDFGRLEDYIISKGYEVLDFMDYGDYCQLHINTKDKEEIIKLINEFED